MADFLERAEEFLGIHKASGSAFLKLATSLPMVADTMSYVKGEYIKIKSKNQILDAFMNGVEISVGKATSTAYEISKSLVPYDYMDNAAFNGLKKVEEKFPAIKKPAKEIWHDCSTYTRATISGIKDERKVPEDFGEAVQDRISLVVKGTVNRITDSTLMKMVSSNVHAMLNKLENIIEPTAASSSTKGQRRQRAKKDNILRRIFDLTSKAKLKLQDLAQEVSELKGEVRDAEKLSWNDMWNVTEHWLSKQYKKLHISPKEERLLVKTWRLCKIAVVGGTLRAMRAADAACPKIKNLIENMLAYIKKNASSIGKSLRKCFNQAYKTTKDTSRKVADLIKNIPSMIKHLLKKILDDLIRIEQEASDELIEEPSLRLSVRKSGRQISRDGPNDEVETMVGASKDD